MKVLSSMLGKIWGRSGRKTSGPAAKRGASAPTSKSPLSEALDRALAAGLVEPDPMPNLLERLARTPVSIPMAGRAKAPTRGAGIQANIAKIAAYTGDHPELQRAHHFLYDLRYPGEGIPAFVVMGINPGETAEDWEAWPEPTEETSRFDFHERSGKGRSAIRWSTLANYFLDGADYVLAELFFWSSSDMAEFEARYGPLRVSKHLTFCTAMNRELIEHYRPRAVVCPGIGNDKLAAGLYGLKHLQTIRSGSVRVVERYTDGSRHWLFTKHWTGSFGLSAEQKADIRQAIRAVGSPT